MLLLNPNPPFAFFGLPLYPAKIHRVDVGVQCSDETLSFLSRDLTLQEEHGSLVALKLDFDRPCVTNVLSQLFLQVLCKFASVLA